MNSAQLDTIAQLIDEQNRTLNAGIQKRIWIMVALLVFVIGYMTFITVSLARTVTPDNISDIMVGAMVENAPAARNSLVTAAGDAIPMVVDTGFKQIHELLPEIRAIMLHQVEASLPRLSEDFYQILGNDIDRYFVSHDMVLDSIVEKIDTPEKRQAVLKDMEKVIKRDISLFMNEAVNETRLLQESLKVLIDTPEKKLSVEERKLKELMIYFLYLIKEQKA
jgi:hypothetical protein